MGYACPVCETPQMDATHLANHLAFTALLGDEGHEAWLDEHVPEWGELNESTLGERVAEHAKEAGFPQVFEDTTGASEHDDAPEERSGALFDDGAHAGHDHAGHDHAGHDHAGHDHGPAGGDRLDDETERVLEEARELTRRMHDEAADETDEGEEE